MEEAYASALSMFETLEKHRTSIFMESDAGAST